MNSRETFLKELRDDLLSIHEIEQKLRALMSRSDVSDARKHEDYTAHASEIERLRSRVERELDRYTHFPQWHEGHARHLQTFWQNGPYEKSVFIMTKFPDPLRPSVKDRRLQEVVKTVAEAVKRQGHVPRIAGDKDYHEQLWENVELHMLGCHRGIAIVQDRSRPEFNPNVALEWGWMLGLDRKVLYLVEKDFRQERADWKGMTSYRFDWNNPKPGVDAAIRKFLS